MSSSNRPRILIVEDDERIRQELLDALRAAQFEVDFSISLAGARRKVNVEFDLIVLDLSLPDGDGLDLCRDLRSSARSVPVIMLTARDAPEQRVRGLDVGADDYLVKPFHIPELIARIRSVLRRSGPTQGGEKICYGSLWLDAESRCAGKNGKSFDLTPREFELLQFFMRYPDRAWTREQLLDRVWGRHYNGDIRTVDLHVSRLRSHIENDPSDPRFLETVWGIGYRLHEA